MIGFIFEYLPAINTLPGLIMFAIVTYIISLLISTCVGSFINNNLDVEKGVREQIIYNRNKKLQQLKKRGVPERIAQQERKHRQRVLGANIGINNKEI